MFRVALAACSSLLLCLCPSAPPHAATLTVTTTSLADASDGGCSLREAILALNQGASRNECSGSGYGSNDRIHFNIPGSGVRTLVVTEQLPSIMRPVHIDGLTQPGASCDAWPATLRIELDGQGSIARGLILASGSGGSVIRGLVIGGMASTADNFSAALMLASNGNRIECNYLGLRADGSSANPNRRGIDINSASDNIIGTDGTLPALGRRNLIGSNLFGGINTRGMEPSRNVIGGNYIGVDASGTLSRSNRFGVSIGAASNSPAPALDNVIGYNGIGSPEFARNVISGNVDGAPGLPGSGIDMQVNVQRTRIAGNYIGLDAAGAIAVPNGVGISIGSNASVRDNLVGFPSAQPLAVSGNVISGNLWDGIAINGNNGADRSFIVGNLIGTYPSGAAGVPNGRFGIDLVNGTRALVNGNVISGHVSAVRLWGTSTRPMSSFINAEPLPTGGAALDSRDNCITGNSDGAQVVYNGAAATAIVFEHNWWGAANGPGGAVGGNGDRVPPDVDAVPFLTSVPPGCAVTPVADLSVDVSGLPDPLRAGEAFGASVSVANAGPDGATGAVLRIAPSPGVSLDPPAGCSAVGGNVDCALPPMASGAGTTVALEFGLAADVSGSAGFTVSVLNPVLDPVAGNNSRIIARDVAVTANLGLGLSAPGQPLIEGDAARLRLHVANSGPARIADAVATLTVPAGFAAAEWTCTGYNGGSCAPAGNGDIVQALTLPPGAAVQFELTGRIEEITTLSASASLALPPGADDPDASDNAVQLNLAVAKVHELKVLFAAPTPLAVEGELYTYTLRVDNVGPSTARAAHIAQRDTLALRDLLWTCAGAGGSCAAVGSGAIDDVIDLAPGAHVRYEVSGFANAPQSAQLEAVVTAAPDSVDPVAATDVGDYALTIQPRRIFADGVESAPQ